MIHLDCVFQEEKLRIELILKINLLKIIRKEALVAGEAQHPQQEIPVSVIYLPRYKSIFCVKTINQ